MQRYIRADWSLLTEHRLRLYQSSLESPMNKKHLNEDSMYSLTVLLIGDSDQPVMLNSRQSEFIRHLFLASSSLVVILIAFATTVWKSEPT